MAVAAVHSGGIADHIHPEPEGFLRKYVFSIDHKIIGIQYIVTAGIFMILAGALAELIRSAEAIKPEPAGPLAAVLAETVARFVRQIVGEVKIDPAMLKERAETIAEMVTAESGPARLRMHPEDIAMLDGVDLGLPMAPDHHLTSGTIILETGEGWIEDGPQVRLARLRSQLDNMGLPR